MTRETIKEVCGLSEYVDETIKALDQRTEKVMSDKRCCISPVTHFDGMTNKEIISEFVMRDDSFAIMVDEVNGTVNIELSLDFWNAPYEKGEE